MAFQLDVKGNIKGFGYSAADPTNGPILAVDEGSNVAVISKFDAATNTTAPVLRLIHRSSAAPAGSGFGAELNWQLHDSANLVAVAGRIQCYWTDPTTTTPVSQMDFLVNNASNTPVARLRITGAGVVTALTALATNGDFTITDAKNIIVGSTTGTQIGTATTQKLGFFGAAPVVQQVNASAGGIATVADAPAKAALTAIRTALINLGLAAATA